MTQLARNMPMNMEDTKAGSWEKRSGPGRMPWRIGTPMRMAVTESPGIPRG